jgi:hypothetical protein
MFRLVGFETRTDAAVRGDVVIQDSVMLCAWQSIFELSSNHPTSCGDSLTGTLETMDTTV